MPTETVDTLELVIQASAESAAGKVESLAASVRTLGEGVAKYIGSMNTFASSLQSIVESLGNLKGIRNLRTIMEGAGRTAAGQKEKAIGGAMGSRFKETSTAIARDMNSSLQGTSYKTKDLASEIQSAREKITQGATEAAILDIKRIADELAGSAGRSAISFSIKDINDKMAEDGYKYISVALRDIYGIGGLKNANDELGRMGASFRFIKSGSRTAGVTSADSLAMKFGNSSIGDRINSPEGLLDYLREVYTGYQNAGGGHKSTMAELGAINEREFATQIFGDLMDRVFPSGTADSGNGVDAAGEARSAAMAIRDEAEAVRDLGEARSALAETNNAQHEETMGYIAQGIVEAKTQEATQSVQDTVNDLTGVNREFKDASESAAVFQEAITEGVVSEATVPASQSLQEMIDDITGVSRSFKDAAASAEVFQKALTGMSSVEQANAALRHTGAEDYRKYLDEVREHIEAQKADQEMTQLRAALSNNTPEMIGLRRESAMSRGVEFLKKYDELFSSGIPNLADRGVAAGLIDENTASAMKEAAGFMQDVGNSATNAAPALQEASSAAETVGEAAQDAAPAIQEVAPAIQEAGSATEESGTAATEAADSVRELGEASEETTASSGRLNGILNNVANTLKHSVIGQLARVAKMRMLRYAIRSVASGFKEGINNMYQWSKALNGGFASSMDTAASKAMYLKNSLATAVAPLIQSLIPVLSNVVSWINAASNAIAQFFALLNGKNSWTKATETVEEYAASAKKATGSAKEDMKDLLADWDELNIIQSETGSGSGGSGSSTSKNYSDMFEETSQFDEWTKNFEEIKNIVEVIGIGIAAWYGLSKIEDFLSKLGLASTKFGAIKEMFLGGITLYISWQLAGISGKALADGDIKTGIASGVGSAIAGALGGMWISKGIAKFLGISGATGGLGAVLGVSFALGLIADTAITQIRTQTYAQMAKNAFASAGKNGFNVSEYKAAVEKELKTQMGNLSVAIDAFENYGTAKQNLEDAAAALANLTDKVRGGEKLTTEEANEFNRNWTMVYQAMNQMHTATWNTLNFGIAEAVKSETGEAKEALVDLQKQLIEIARVSGGSLGAWQEEMRQISGRISAGTASDDDVKRYVELTELLTDSDISDSVSEMKDWSDIVTGFDFGDGEHAITNAINFVDEMGETYSNAQDEVKEFERTEKKAVEAAKKELAMLLRDGKIDQTYYNNSMETLNKVSEAIEKKVQDDLAEIGRLQTETYDELLNQILVGAAINGPQGIDEYIKQVEPLIETLQKVGAELPDELKTGVNSEFLTWLDSLGISATDAANGLSLFFAHLGGGEANKSWYFETLLPALQGRLGDEKYAKLFNQLPEDTKWDIISYNGEDAIPEGWQIVNNAYVPIIGDIEPVTITLEPITPDGFSLDEDGKYKIETKDANIAVTVEAKETGTMKYNDDGSWEWTPNEQKTVTFNNPKWMQQDGKWVRNSEIDSVEEVIEEFQTELDEHHAILTIDPVIEDEEDDSILDQWDTGADQWKNSGSAGAISGAAQGNTTWFNPSTEEVNVDAAASGMALDSTMQSLIGAVNTGDGEQATLLQSVISFVRRIEEYAKTTSEKDFTVNVFPSSTFGRNNAMSQRMYAQVTGEGNG